MALILGISCMTLGICAKAIIAAGVMPSSESMSCIHNAMSATQFSPKKQL